MSEAATRVTSGLMAQEVEAPMQLDSSTSKLCTSCHSTKPITAFHRRREGYQPKCKECTLAYNRQYRAANRNDIAAQDKVRSGRFKTPEGRAKRAAYQRNRRRSNPAADRSARRQLPSYGVAYTKRTPEAARAHSAVQRALKSGRLVRPTACTNCGRSDSRIEGAHLDYSKPLDVIWLCAMCHREMDKKMPRGGTERLA